MEAIGQILAPASGLPTKEQSITILQEIGWVPFSLILLTRPQTASMTTPKPSSPISATIASHVATDDRPIWCPDYQILKSSPGFKTDRLIQFHRGEGCSEDAQCSGRQKACGGYAGLRKGEGARAALA